MFWGTMPDDALFAAAAAGDLANAAGVEKQARRLLADARSLPIVSEFGVEWLGVGSLLTADKNPSKFPAVLRAQSDRMVLAISCGLTQVGMIQASYHTSELLMSRFAEAPELYNPSFDMRSHQASPDGGSHDPSHNEYKAFTRQVRWWMSQFAYLLDRLKSTPTSAVGRCSRPLSSCSAAR